MAKRTERKTLVYASPPPVRRESMRERWDPVPPERVRSARKTARLTQREAERVVRLQPTADGKRWGKWETRGGMAPAYFELFLLRTGQEIPDWL